MQWDGAATEHTVRSMVCGELSLGLQRALGVANCVSAPEMVSPLMPEPQPMSNRNCGARPLAPGETGAGRRRSEGRQRWDVGRTRAP